MSIEILDNETLKPFEETLKWAIAVKDKKQKINIEQSLTILVIFGGIIFVLFMIWIILVSWSSTKKRSDDWSDDEDSYSDEFEEEEIINNMAQPHIPLSKSNREKTPVHIPSGKESESRKDRKESENSKNQEEVRRVTTPTTIRLNQKEENKEKKSRN